MTDSPFNEMQLFGKYLRQLYKATLMAEFDDRLSSFTKRASNVVGPLQDRTWRWKLVERLAEKYLQQKFGE